MKTIRFSFIAVLMAIIVGLGVTAWGACSQAGQEPSLTGAPAPGQASSVNAALGSTDEQLAWLFETRQQGVYVTGAGTVERLLSDDTEGSQHQRFILRLASGQTLLVAHNIDIAPRVEPLAVGDEVYFAGIYEYNSEGGVIHWTHHDPNGIHTSGYLRVGDTVFS